MPVGGVGAALQSDGSEESYGARFAWPVTAVAQCLLSVDVSIFQVIVLSAVKRCTMRMSIRVPPAALCADQVHVSPATEPVKLARWPRLLKESYFAPGKAALLSVGEQIDTRSAAGRLVLNVLASVSQWEREAIGERTATVMQHKARQGEYTGGQAPYGRRVAPDGSQL